MNNKSIFASICYFFNHIIGNSTINQDLINDIVISYCRFGYSKSCRILSCKKTVFSLYNDFLFYQSFNFLHEAYSEKEEDICLHLQPVNYSVLGLDKSGNRKTGKKKICIRSDFFYLFPLLSVSLGSFFSPQK